MLTRLVAVLLVGASMAACTSSPVTRPASQVRSSPAVPPSASAASGPEDLLLLVASGKSTLGLYAASARSHHARLVRSLAGPVPAVPVADVTVSGGTSPVACATWATQPQAELWCYDGGASEGRIVASAQDVGVIAISVDGSRIAWTEPTDPDRQDIVTADLRNGVASNLLRWAPDPQCTGECTVFSQPIGLAWTGDDELTVSVATQDDEGPGLLRLPLTAATRQKGWLTGGHLVQPPARDQQRGWRYYDAVASATTSASSPFLAIERPSENGPPRLVSARGVRVMSPSLPPVVLAKALRGRDVVAISGGSRAVVYETDSGYAAPTTGRAGRFYLAFAGELVGRPLTGLPPGTWLVTAAPL